MRIYIYELVAIYKMLSIICKYGNPFIDRLEVHINTIVKIYKACITLTHTHTHTTINKYVNLR